ncbi:histidine kinase [Pseudonocardia sp. RS11V-5]|uniref:sensor histidine kinase n=1 Tax=Pseudonocardia terrae TaxID=2905831 RepID=UPI001E3FAFCB|nr:histidine kinase [Pseudonocardia terrae]MCE3549844.1 histidine kinase [Pseudonocardia terrae]
MARGVPVRRGGPVWRLGVEILAVGLPAVFVLLGAPGPYEWSVAAGLVGCALLPLRHVRPWLAVVGSLGAIWGGLGWPAQIVALYVLGRRTRLAGTVPWLVAVVVAAVVPVLHREVLSWQSVILTIVFAVLSAGSPLGFGLLTATRERLTTSLRELEDAREATVAARESAARAEERARIGREVHDAVGHHATLIAVGAAALSASTEEQRTREAADVLRTHAKEALAEMRSALGLVGPAPAGAAALGELVDRARDAGLDAELVALGIARTLPAAPDQTVYRVVQEALTNAARHSPGSTVRVEVDWRTSDRIRVEVGNGPARRPVRGTFGTGGAGLAGLAERVRAVGGELTSGPDADGFRVCTVLPLAPETPPTGVRRVDVAAGHPAERDTDTGSLPDAVRPS